MVICNLYHYMWRKVPGTSKCVSIRQLADDCRKKHKKPILVTEGKNFVLELVLKELRSRIHEFDFADYVNTLREIVQVFESLEIKMVFFFGAGKEINSWLSHLPKSRCPRHKLLESITSTFDLIREGSIPDSTRVIPGLISATRYILKYMCGCTVYCAMTDECRSIAEYAAKTPACFGIFGTIADHLIFGSTPLLSMKNFDKNNMTTNMFQRSALLAQLEMEIQQLPILACMAGNDVITADELADFYREISPKNGGRDVLLIEKIKKYIRRNGWSGSENELPEISRRIGITEELLRKGVSYYNISEGADDVVEDVTQTLSVLYKKCFHCTVPSDLYVILRLKKYNRVPPMEDLKDNSIPSTVLIYRPIRQRMYHLLFDEEPACVEEWCAYRNKNPDEADRVWSVEIKVGGDIPLLRNLLSEEVDYEVRWKLFKACLGISIPTEKLSTIETHLVTLCCLLNFLLHVESVNLEEFEVKSFICQALKIDLSSTLGEQKVSIRALSLAGILWEGFRSLIYVVPVCGFPFPFEDVMAWRYFNGKVFYWCYNQLKDTANSDSAVRSLMNDDSEAVAKFHRLYSITVAGTRLGSH